jgi:DNA-binding beta-propeller fold protein YncE
MKSPYDVVLDSRTQKLYVLGKDHEKNCVCIFSIDGKKHLGKFELRDFNIPWTWALHPHSSLLYITDNFNRRVQVVTLDGRFVRQFGKGTFEHSGSVAIDSSTGLVFISDQRHCAVFVFDANDNFLFRFGSFGSGDGQLSFPHHMCVDNGKVFVTDSSNHRVSIFSTRGEFRRCFGSYGSADGQFRHPTGIALHPSRSEIIVTDTSNHRLQVFDRRTSVFLRSHGSGSSSRSTDSDVGNFDKPCGVCIDPSSGAIYVCDSGNDRVQIFW